METQQSSRVIEVTKSALGYSWALSMLGAQTAYHMVSGQEGAVDAGRSAAEAGLTPEDKLHDLFKAAYEAGDHVQREFWDSLAHYMSVNALYNPGVALQLGTELVWDLAESTRFFRPDNRVLVAWREIFNKVDVYQLVRSVQKKLRLPREGEFDLAEYVEKAYALGPYPALWAVEGLGHDYADSVRERGEEWREILRGERIKGIPDQSLLMLHAGIGLSFAQRLMEPMTAKTPEEELRAAVQEFVRLCRDNSEPGYAGAALESLGLVTRTFHSELLGVVDRLLEEDFDSDVRGFFWHGVGRAVYFLLVNFLPYRDPVWRAIEIGRRESTGQLAQENLVAGTAWALTLVNMRQPQVMAAFLEDHGDDLWEHREAFANGVASSLTMRFDTSPDDPFIESFRNYEPNPDSRRLVDLWQKLIRDPADSALERYHPVLKKNKRLDEVFRFRSLDQLVEQLGSEASAD